MNDTPTTPTIPDEGDELLFEDLEERTTPGVSGACACTCSCSCSSCSCVIWF